jgi:NitT/TauT family transport system substrate-binding protein
MKTLNIIIASILLIGLTSCDGNQTEAQQIKNTDKNIVFAVPFAPVSYPIIKMIEDGTFNKNGKTTELILWKTPDQLKALVAGKQADIFAVPSNTAAIFYNKGIDVKLLNISIWRAIWLVSRSNDKKTLADFKGEEIAMPFKGDMPHIVFMALARKQGLDPEKDFKLQYVPSPMDAAQKMIMRRVDNALLIDPAVSTVIEKSKSGVISIVAPDIYRSVDIQNEWGRLYNTENELPFAGIMAGSEILKDPKLLKEFTAEYKKAAEWCMAHPEETAKMVVKHIPQLNEKGVAEAMRNVTLKSVSATDARKKLEAFFTVLKNEKPALIGGKLPDDNFYFKIQ